MKAKEIIRYMDVWALPKLIDSWDNTGFQIGDDEREVSRILLALDVDEEICKKAMEEDFHMVITHHPLIFKPMKSVNTLTHKGRIVYDLIRKGIVIYNAHSNLDQTEGGINDELARLLHLKNSRPLQFNEQYLEKPYGYGKIGDINEIPLKDYIGHIKEALSVSHLTVFGQQERMVKRVAICGGSGSEFIYDAYKEGACVYITGDIKYHDAQLGHEMGITIIDAGHFHTEKVILPVMKNYLEKMEERLHIEIWEKPSPTYKIY